MKQFLILFFYFISFDLFSQISLPTYHATHIVKTAVNNFQIGDPLIIAGGGGGVIYQVNPHSGMHASITETGNSGKNGTAGGTNGSGGSATRGGGGGGFLTDGGEDSRRPGTKGISFTNGGLGGNATDTNTGDGGFGGGGASIRVNNNIGDQGAGGGGGYSGGGGAGSNNQSHGGGGGSYNAGSTKVNVTHPNGNVGHGKVIITQGGSTWTFTNCGASGRTGPTQNQCNSSYSGSSLAGNITLVDGIQHWTIPATATYTIKAYGASGGDNGKDPGWTGCPHFCRDGGHGAIMQGDFTLSSGTVLKILVGHHPNNVNWLNGGGGGTFVVLSN